jgi:hypothetical protein
MYIYCIYIYIYIYIYIKFSVMYIYIYLCMYVTNVCNLMYVGFLGGGGWGEET